MPDTTTTPEATSAATDPAANAARIAELAARDAMQPQRPLHSVAVTIVINGASVDTWVRIEGGADWTDATGDPAGGSPYRFALDALLRAVAGDRVLARTPEAEAARLVVG